MATFYYCEFMVILKCGSSPDPSTSVPSLNEICESIFELSCTQVKTYGSGGERDVKPVCPRLSSGDTNRVKSSYCKYRVVSFKNRMSLQCNNVNLVHYYDFFAVVI